MRTQPLPILSTDSSPSLPMTTATDDEFNATIIKTFDAAYKAFYDNAQGKRVSTDEVIAEALRAQYPNLHLTLTPTNNCRLLAFAASGKASATPIDADNKHTENLKWRLYVPPARRMDNVGFLVDDIQFGKYLYKWTQHGTTHEYIVYQIVGGKATEGMFEINMTYILGADQVLTDELILAACKFNEDIHDRVLLFDQGYWELSAELYQSVQNSSWDDVILEPEMKKSIKGEVHKFFNSREKYQNLKIPWKRGIIYYGPPGNGKTISIKATMHMLYSRPDPIPTLYVRSLTSFRGPEYSLMEIFRKARQEAPCLLVFEDLDSIVTDSVRSYFLNEVDGLKNNDGILMVGSTNHLERLDPGISKRPSRFDRKYCFPNPTLEERVAYCAFWRGKLSGNEEIEFPEKMEWAIAGITKGFSFAYIQEAFLTALLAIANGEASEREKAKEMIQTATCECHSMNCKKCMAAQQWRNWAQSGCRTLEEGDDDDLEQYVLWREIKKAVKSLRDELE